MNLYISKYEMDYACFEYYNKIFICKRLLENVDNNADFI